MNEASRHGESRAVKRNTGIRLFDVTWMATALLSALRERQTMVIIASGPAVLEVGDNAWAVVMVGDASQGRRGRQGRRAAVGDSEWKADMMDSPKADTRMATLHTPSVMTCSGVPGAVGRGAVGYWKSRGKVG
jgi:hypothetical protein